MIRAKFGHSRKGVYFAKGKEIDNLNEDQEKEAVDMGWAYYDSQKPTESDTVKYIKDYLNQEGIEFESSMNKAELLELC